MSRRKGGGNTARKLKRKAASTAVQDSTRPSPKKYQPIYPEHFDLGNLPRELVLQILEQLLAEGDLATSTSLGLTCRSLYEILKELHPKPIIVAELQHTATHHGDLVTGNRCRGCRGCRLPKIIGEFLGPKYRGVRILPQLFQLMQFPVPAYRALWTKYGAYHFLNTEVYGTEHGSEAELRFMSNVKYYVESQFAGRTVDNPTNLVPCPIGKELGWGGEVLQTSSSGNPRVLDNGLDVELRAWYGDFVSVLNEQFRLYLEGTIT